MRRDPRTAFSLIAATVERGMGAARSAAEGADTELKAATVEVDADGRSTVFARRGAERRRHSTAQLTSKFRKSTSIAPRSARESLADGRDMYP
ncbi:hypothetical protein GGF50DRAFT_121704 [Schizophyllum commune]